MTLAQQLKEGLMATENTNGISEYLRSGCTLIDLNMGGAPGVLGYKRGVFHRLSGVKGAGKTFLVTEVGAIAKKKYDEKADVAIQDCEERNTMNTEELYGVPREDLLSDNPPETVEELDAHMGIWLKGIKKNTVGIYAVDSLESLTNADVENRTEERQKKYEAGKEVVDKGTMGMQTAKFWSQEFFRTKKNALSSTGSTCFLLSQMRENVDRKNPYSPKYKTTGGPGIDHWMDSASELKVVCQIGTKERPIGAVVELKTTKLTAPRPFRKCRYIVYYSYGIDNIGSNIDYLFDLRGEDGKIRETVASTIAWDGKPISMKLVKEWIADFDEAHETNLMKEAKQAHKEAEGRAVLSVDWHPNWFRTHESDVVRDTFCEEFGTGDARCFTRDDLILAVEADPEMEKELEERVIAKWEALEAEAAAPLAGRRRRH